MAKDNEELLKELRDRHKRAIDAEHDNRTEARDDLQFIIGGDNQWPDQAARTRRVEGRPCLTINKLPTFIHQVTNDQLQNKPQSRSILSMTMPTLKRPKSFRV